ncbi:MAG: alanine racemase, partial [Candidatus Binatia bacterium]
MIGDRYRRVRERASRAAVRAGRRPEEVTVVVAAKAFAAEAVLEAIRAGARDIGENYVQEAHRKRERLRSLDADGGVRWHMIGRLQRNKAKHAIGFFEIIHSLDGEPLARTLDRAAASAGIRASCLIEVNLGNESTKAGVAADRVVELFEEVAS